VEDLKKHYFNFTSVEDLLWLYLLVLWCCKLFWYSKLSSHAVGLLP